MAGILRQSVQCCRLLVLSLCYCWPAVVGGVVSADRRMKSSISSVSRGLASVAQS